MLFSSAALKKWVSGPEGCESRPQALPYTLASPEGRSSPCPPPCTLVLPAPVLSAHFSGVHF